MESLSLLLENGSEEYVWAEEIEIFLSGLRRGTADCEPSLRGIRKIRQMVRAGDTLPISLCEVIYKAAGNPQRTIPACCPPFCDIASVNEWIEKRMENYRLRMMGLTASGVRRERKPVHPSTARKPRDVPGVVTELNKFKT